MTHIDASQLDYRQLNAAIRDCAGDVAVTGCLGQRFIGAGRGHDRLTITGTPGNALGAYLDGACIEVRGDAQDAVGDTMNAGRIIVHGSIGDAAGYAMRGGELYVAGNAGYRAGIHMKAYGDKLPVMVIGGRAGSFLGEYQAGGIIIVLGLTDGSRPIVSNFPCTACTAGSCSSAPTAGTSCFPVRSWHVPPFRTSCGRSSRICIRSAACSAGAAMRSCAIRSPSSRPTAPIPTGSCMLQTE